MKPNLFLSAAALAPEVRSTQAELRSTAEALRAARSSEAEVEAAARARPRGRARRAGPSENRQFFLEVRVEQPLDGRRHTLAC